MACRAAVTRASTKRGPTSRPVTDPWHDRNAVLRSTRPCIPRSTCTLTDLPSTQTGTPLQANAPPRPWAPTRTHARVRPYVRHSPASRRPCAALQRKRANSAVRVRLVCLRMRFIGSPTRRCIHSARYSAHAHAAAGTADAQECRYPSANACSLDTSAPTFALTGDTEVSRLVGSCAHEPWPRNRHL